MKTYYEIYCNFAMMRDEESNNSNHFRANMMKIGMELIIEKAKQEGVNVDEWQTDLEKREKI